MPKRLSSLSGFLFASVTLVMIVGALEAAASLLIQSKRYAVIDDPLLHHVWRPNHRLEHKEWIADNPEYPSSYIHQANGQGWRRNTDVSVEKPDKTWRVFYVGDSFVEGTVPMELTLPGQVERTLAPILQRSGWKLEVINTGMSSWSPTLYSVLVRKVLVDFDPDVIVVVVDMTDDYDDWLYRDLTRFDEAGMPLAVPANGPRSKEDQGTATPDSWVSLESFLRKNSALYSMVRERNARISNETPDSDSGYSRWSWTQHSWDEATREAVDHTLLMLEGIALFCKENNIRLLVTGAPHRQQLGVSASGTSKWSVRPHTELDLFAAKHGAAYLDAIAAMAPHVRDLPPERLYYRRDIHLNPDGYRVWGEAHIDFFTDPHNKLLPPVSF